MLQPSNPNGGKQMMDNYDILTPEQLRMGAVKMRYELDNLYKVRDDAHLQSSPGLEAAMRHELMPDKTVLATLTRCA